MANDKKCSVHVVSEAYAHGRMLERGPIPFREATIRKLKFKPPSADSLRRRRDKQSRLDFEKLLENIYCAPDKTFANFAFVCEEHPWLIDEIPQRVWNRIKKASGLPNQARGVIGFLVIVFRGSAIPLSAPKSARDLERPLKALTRRLNVFLEDEVGLNFVMNIGRNPMTAAMIKTTELYERLNQATSTLAELSLRLEARGLRTRKKKLPSSPLALVRALNEALLHFCSRRLSRSKTSSDLVWVDEVCSLVTNYGPGQVQRSVQLAIQDHLARHPEQPSTRAKSQS